MSDVINIIDQRPILHVVDERPNVSVATPGPQGPRGVQNLFVGEEPPTNPQEGFVWINTGDAI